MGRPRSSSSASAVSDSAPKIERKIIEKNRRNRMKFFISNLISLLPNNMSNEGLPLPDQIGEVVDYIESFKLNLEKLKEKKESLLPKYRSNLCFTTQDQLINEKINLVEVHDMGENIAVIFVDGIRKYSTFRKIISFLKGEGVEIASANFSFGGYSSIQVLQNKIVNPNFEFGGSTMVERLRDLVCGSSSRSTMVDAQLSVWDYKIE